jgi:hypothetical protein
MRGLREVRSQRARIRSADEWAQILERYDASDLTQEAFSRREGIRYSTLAAWLGRRRKRSGQLPEPKPSSGKSHELSLPDGRPSQVALEVRLADGTRLRVKKDDMGGVVRCE